MSSNKNEDSTGLIQLMATSQESAERDLVPHVSAFRKAVTRMFPRKEHKTAKAFYQSVDKKYTDDDMFWIYLNAAGYQHFRPYAEEQGITNLVDFVNECIKLKPLNENKDRYSVEFGKIYNRFLAVQANESINISSTLRQALQEEFERLTK
jgi:hypothetical protein